MDSLKYLGKPAPKGLANFGGKNKPLEDAVVREHLEGAIKEAIELLRLENLDEYPEDFLKQWKSGQHYADAIRDLLRKTIGERP